MHGQLFTQFLLELQEIQKHDGSNLESIIISYQQILTYSR